MTSASERRTGQIDGPRGRRFVEVEDWARLPEGWSFCDVPGVTVGPDDRVYLFNRGNCPRSADHTIIVLEPDGTFVRSFGEGYFTFAHAIAMGVDFVEIDIRRTTDGVFVNYHDDHAPSGRAARGMSYAALEEELGDELLTVEQLVEIIDGKVGLHVDVKE